MRSPLLCKFRNGVMNRHEVFAISPIPFFFPSVVRAVGGVHVIDLDNSGASMVARSMEAQTGPISEGVACLLSEMRIVETQQQHSSDWFHEGFGLTLPLLVR